MCLVEILQAQQRHVPVSDGIGRWPALQLQAEFDIVDHVQPGQQRVFLKHDRRSAPGPSPSLAVQRDLPLKGAMKPCHQVSAASTCPCRRPQGATIGLVHVQVDVVQSDDRRGQPAPDR
ncbi:hypothetical protein [Paracoccus mutanolyticus]|uniref:hypothetical protein n=1 Tax=Paracoccus mutanolyticus TaxID=1499308 RepID=UPI001CB95284|nr:hypothetical protein [Paracoccus mutanolyticus]